MHVPAQSPTRVRELPFPPFLILTKLFDQIRAQNPRTKTRRKSPDGQIPLKTLTLEDFLESERHKLTGTLTPVTPETFAKWKKERLDKKAAEMEAQKAKDATGKAMFESGEWKGSEDEDSDDDDDDEGEDDEDGKWNLDAMRRETERLREQREQERLAKLNGLPLPSNNHINGDLDSGGDNDDDDDDGDGSSGDETAGSHSNGEGASGES